MSLLLLAAAGAAQAALVPFTIIHANDLRSNVMPNTDYNLRGNPCLVSEFEADPVGCIGGASRRRAFIDMIRASRDASITVSTGDSISGSSTFYKTFASEPDVEFMNGAGFELAGIDAGEFVRGPFRLALHAQALDAQFLSCNLQIFEPTLFELVTAYQVRAIAGLNVAFIGISPEDVVSSSAAGSDVAVLPLIETLTETVAEVQALDVDLIVVMGNIKVPDVERIEAEVTGIDIIIFGGFSLLDEAPMVLEDRNNHTVYASAAGSYGNYMGVLDIVYDTELGAVSSAVADVRLLNITDPDVEEHPFTQSRQEFYGMQLEETFSQVVGETTVELLNDDCRQKECLPGNFFADAVRDWAGTQISFVNGGSIRTDIPVGEFTRGDIDEILPFFNLVSRFGLEGVHVLEALENGVSRINNPEASGGTGRFLQVSGLRYTWNPNNPLGSRMSEVEVLDRNGEYQPLASSITYSVAASDFLRRGGDDYTMFLEDAISPDDFGILLSDAVLIFLNQTDGPITPVFEGRIVNDTLGTTIELAPGNVNTGNDISIGEDTAAGGSSGDNTIVIVVPVVAAVVIAVAFLLFRRRVTTKYIEKDADWLVDEDDILIKEKIGAGAFGAVFRATWRGGDVAVKVIHDVSREALSGFKAEIALLSSLRHPNCVLFMGASVSGSRISLITEFMNVGALSDLLAEPGFSMPDALRFRLVTDAARGMSYLHTNKPPIIHNDLKANNLLVDDKFNIKVADFGLSTLHGSVEVEGDNRDGPVGTALWTAPEIFRGHEPTVKSDAYSYGITMWEILEQKTPFQDAENPWGTLIAITEKGLRPKITVSTASVYINMMKKCWDADPSNRPSFAEIVDALSELTVTGSQSAILSATSSRDRAGSFRVSTADAPKGDVSMVFTDIESSSTLWESQPSATFDGINLHNDLIRPIVTKYRGFEVKTDGDAFFIVFADPSDSVRFCLEAQDALRRADWPEELVNHPASPKVEDPDNPDGPPLFVGFRVRMGIHVGPVRCSTNPITMRTDYFGPSVNRAARVSSRAAGGQTLISKSIYDAAQDVLNDDSICRTISIGSFHLKGMAEPEALYEILPPSLAKRSPLFPAVQDMEVTSGSVPYPGAPSSTASEAKDTPMENLLESVSEVSRFRIDPGQIEVSESLGRGSYGEVFRGTYDGRAVAVKKLFFKKMDVQMIALLRREVSIYSAIHHENLVDFLGVCVSPPQLVLELVDGHSLKIILSDKELSKRLNHTFNEGVLRDTLRALAFLHSQSPPIIHRDLSPSNILVSGHLPYQAKLCDFGLARVKNANQTMTTVGTSGYQAPEIFVDGRYSEKVDLFSLGSIMFELYANRQAFPGNNPIKVSKKIRAEARPDIPPNVPQQMSNLIMSCWAADPDKRPSASELLESL